MTTGNERGSGVKNFHKNLMQFSVDFSKNILFSSLQVPFIFCHERKLPLIYFKYLYSIAVLRYTHTLQEPYIKESYLQIRSRKGGASKHQLTHSLLITSTWSRNNSPLKLSILVNVGSNYRWNKCIFFVLVKYPNCKTHQMKYGVGWDGMEDVLFIFS